MRTRFQETLARLEKRINAFVPHPAFRDDSYLIVALKEAFIAVQEGNGGVGAVLANEQGQIVVRGRNRMFYPYFRSDLHAEMDVLTRFEENYKDKTLNGYTLYSTLEPCEMCLIRIILSGVSRVVFAADDSQKGGITGPNKLPEQWRRLAAGQAFAAAACSPELAELSRQLFDLALPDALNKLQARRARHEVSENG
jgi:cytosine deaminase